MTKLLLLIPLALLFLACDNTEPAVTDWVVREVEVIKEVPVEVIVEVPVEVIVEVPVAPANCPPSSEVDWLIWSLEDARDMHQAWADFLRDNPLADGSGLIRNAVGSQAEQLSLIAVYDRRLGIVSQFMEVCGD